MGNKKEKLNFNDLGYREQMLLTEFYQYLDLKNRRVFQKRRHREYRSKFKNYF